MNGIIVIDKPKGKSSNQVVGVIKKLFNQKKVGHLGTLDPLATGVLPICLGKATKLFDYFLTKTKTYIAQFTFGETTDTLDSEGQVLNRCEFVPSMSQINQVLPSFIGELDQMPPKYSAKSINGVRAYELARKGVEFDLKPKQICINKFELTKQISSNVFEFLIDCSSGTYIRSLARDLAQKCGSLAYMSGLRRIRTGQFEIEQAVILERASVSDIISLDKILSSHKKIVVDAVNFSKLKNGNSVKVPLLSGENLLVYCKEKLFGIGDCSNHVLKVKTNLFEE